MREDGFSYFISVDLYDKKLSFEDKEGHTHTIIINGLLTWHVRIKEIAYIYIGIILSRTPNTIENIDLEFIRFSFDWLEDFVNVNL